MSRAIRSLIELPLIHPFLFACWPVMALYGQNAHLYPPSVLGKHIALMAGLAFLLCLLFRILRSSWQTSALMASLIFIAFADLWKPLLRDRIEPHFTILEISPLILYAWYCTLTAALLILVRRQIRAAPPLTIFANVAAITLIVTPSFQLLDSLAKERTQYDGFAHTLSLLATPDAPPTEKATPLVWPTEMPQNRPDVFLIILDAYGRADVLRDRLAFDNGPFIRDLEKRGFSVAENSTSNYPSTQLSLASVFNMNYLDELGQGDSKFRNLIHLVKNSKVFEAFFKLDYKVIAVPAGITLIQPADERAVIIKRKPGWLGVGVFDYAVLELTPAGQLLRAGGVTFAWRNWRNDILFALDYLDEPLKKKNRPPLFVVTHIVCPHSPYVFGADGSARYFDRALSLTGPPAEVGEDCVTKYYTEQLAGLNRHVLKALDDIAKASTEPPIIAIISDHGPNLGLSAAERLKNFCALKLPEPKSDIPANAISNLTMVNLFRLIFNTYFEADFALLERRTEPEPETLQLESMS